MTETEKREKNHIKMTTTAIPKLVLSFAAPTIVATMITAVYNLVDTFFVSRLGTSASAAVGVVFPLMTVVQAFGLMFGHGAASYVSRLLGKKDKDGAVRYGSSSFFYSLFVGVVLSVLGLLNIDLLVETLGATETIAPFAKDYARYILIAVPITTATFVLNTTLRASGNAVKSMIGISIGAVINVVLDPIFIFVLNLGISGAAIATAISQLISFVILVYFCFSNSNLAKFDVRKFTPKYLFNIIKIGVPSFYRQGLTAIGIILLNLATRQFGDAAIASITITSRIFQFVFFFVIGFGQGFQTVCGFNYGATFYLRVKEAYIFSLKVLSGLLFCVACVIFIFAPTIIKAFYSNDAELISMGTETLRYFSFAMPLLPSIVICNMCCQSIGKSLFSSIIAILQNGVFLISFILILPDLIGVTGCQLAMPASQILTFFVTIPITYYLFSLFSSKEQAKLLRGAQ